MTIEAASMKAMTSPCAQCPWRKTNHGKPHPHGWYSQKNRNRLWSGLRTGKAPGMTCHPTDPNNAVPEGWKEVPKETETRECAGALILIACEVEKLNAIGVDAYLAQSKETQGLTKSGLQWWALARITFGGTPFGGPPMPKELPRCDDVARNS